MRGKSAPTQKDVIVREIYLQELSMLGSELERMSHSVTKAITRATTALNDGDVILAEHTIDADERIDEMARAIDDMCVHLLATQGPVASDLRLILAALRLSHTMERQGDLARHIAAIARATYPNHNVAEHGADLIARMGQAAVAIAQDQEKLVKKHDLELAAKIQDSDDIIDDLQADIRRLCADESNNLTRQQVIDLTMAARYLERFGDHATSVARRISFIVSGHRADFTVSTNN